MPKRTPAEPPQADPRRRSRRVALPTRGNRNSVTVLAETGSIWSASIIARVRRAFYVQGWSLKKIVRELHVSWRTGPGPAAMGAYIRASTPVMKASSGPPGGQARTALPLPDRGASRMRLPAGRPSQSSSSTSQRARA